MACAVLSKEVRIDWVHSTAYEHEKRGLYSAISRVAPQRAKIRGELIVGFVMMDARRIANVQVDQSVGGGCDEEAVRVVKGMPDWTRG